MSHNIATSRTHTGVDTTAPIARATHSLVMAYIMAEPLRVGTPEGLRL